jgi:hypothetical protein
MATIVLLFLDHTTSSVVAMSPELPRIIQGGQKVSVHLMITIHISGAQRIFDHSVFALTDFENLQSVWSAAKPRFEVGTCETLSRTVNPLVEYSISYIIF